MKKATTNQTGLKKLMGVLDYTKQLYPNAKAEKKAEVEENKISYETKMHLQSRIYYVHNYIDSLNNILQEMTSFFDL